MRCLLSGVLLALLVLMPVVPATAADGPADPFVVLLSDGTDVDAAITRARRSDDVHATRRFRHAVRGYSASLTPTQVRHLERDPSVDAIVVDAVVELAGQDTPTGVSRIGAPSIPATHIDGFDGPGERIDADVAVIDTGIQPDHPDLNVVGGVNCTTADTLDWADRTGHGTHVAGTIGAIDNDIGIVGAAPGVRLWSVRVFDAKSFSRISWIVCGIDWVTAQRDPTDPDGALIEVANMSLRDDGGDDGNCGYTADDPEHRAICRSVSAGTTYVAAAGNDRTTTAPWRPASYDEVITVSAIADFDGVPGGLAAATCTSFGGQDVDDTFADFSNYGPDVDIAAPGVCIRSTYWGSGYATISGTSMAAPHVSGAAAVYKALNPAASPADVRAALLAAGTDGWSGATDPDGAPDPLLDISTFGAAPSIGLWAIGAPVGVWAGFGTGSVNVRPVRGNSFGGDIGYAIDGLPPGMSATFTPPATSGLGVGPVTLDLRAAASVPAGTYEAVVVARSGALEARRPLFTEVLVDRQPPEAATPRLSLRSPARMSTSSVPLRLTWSGTDVGTGIAGFEQRESRNGGPLVQAPLSPRSLTSRTLSAALGSRLVEEVRASDQVGNASAWSATARIEVAGFGEGTTLASYTGRWTTRALASAWGGRVRSSTARGASVRFRFSGGSVAWVATKGPTLGAARVYVDEVLVGTVDLRAAATTTRRIVFSQDLPFGPHMLRVEVAGTRRVDVDGFLVLRRR